MKLYVHWDAEEPFTKVIKIDDSKAVLELRDACWEFLITRLPEIAASGPDSLRLTSANRRPLSLTSRLSDALSNGDDVFYQVFSPATQAAGPQASVHSTARASAGSVATSAVTAAAAASMPKNSNVPSLTASPSSPAGQDASQGINTAATPSLPTGPQAGGQTQGRPVSLAASAQGGGRSKPNGQELVGDASASESLAPVVHALWLQADGLVAQMHYRGAGEVLQQALLLVPEPSSPTHIATLLRLARLWLSVGNAGTAVQWALRAAKSRPEDPEVLELAGDCLREGGHPREAALQYQSALEALQEAEGKEEGRSPQAAIANESPQVLRLRLSLAACLAVLPGSIMPPYDNQDVAASLVMAVLERDQGHWDAQRLYARMALDRGLREDALKVALRLVVARPKHSGAKALLAECLQDEASCLMLYEELGLKFPDQQPGAVGPAADSSDSSSSGGNSSTAAALAFVATAVKDFGKVDACIALLHRAVRLDPANPSYCLNLVHALELRQDLQAAVEEGRSYCRRCGSRLAGRPLRDVDELLSCLPELHNPLELTWYTAPSLWGSEVQPQRQTQEPPSGAVKESRRGDGSGDHDGGAHQTPGKQPDDSVCGGNKSTDISPTTSPTGHAPVKVSYNANQLDELALLFTMAKLLFVGGALSVASKLCELLEPLRSASAVELHTTLVRNEAAYFGCVTQLLKDYPPPAVRSRIPHPPAATAVTASEASPSDSSPSPLYLCGDSHCLSAAWRIVTLRGEQRVLRPLLVTGCKVWHLRPTSEFYPKKQFEASMDLLPDGAQVILVLGEIDCREGLLLAVQKGKYASVAQGIEATVDIYLDVLRHMILKRRMEVFVHPVPPVLNETRAVVVPFTAALRKAVAAARETDPALRQRLHYLDFFDQLLLPRSQQLGAAAAGIRNTTTISHTAIVSNAGAAEGVGATAGTATASGSAGAALDVASARYTVCGSQSKMLSASAREHGPEGKEEQEAATPAGTTAAATAGWILRPELAFDGTHLAPTYVTVLNTKISEIP
ncbi:hypothetical protein Vafri_16345 [Volvox africanus]|uniref:Uncharacterized protein n=1 Tax=Volvox africanus TaxID=51714 RepID=A0A8J4F6L2_9CHLO|nr:hypothetical protein Vafri_16345 [Volvox africanus]